ncbi:MAG: PilZ domain-containing protein, partial [Dehalococcoidia bacterium]|nr:PilZ domain-containing protein [Dehalococcoidia bacterium]
VAPVAPIHRIQRREFLRWPVDLPSTRGAVVGLDGEDGPRFAARVIDLSGGGLRFECLDPIKAGDTVRILLDLDDEPPFAPYITVIESRRIEVSPTGESAFVKYDCRGFYSAIFERDRRRIIQYIFRQETAQRRAGSSPPLT